MQSTSPWSFVNIPQNLIHGWEENKCITCATESPGVTIKFDNIRVK